MGRRPHASARSSRSCSPASPSTAPVVGLSGGERRRCALAALLLSRHDLIVLDEPTNHLDVEAVAWLAGPPHQPARARSSSSPTTAGSSTRSARPRGRSTTARWTPTRAATRRTSWPRPSAPARPRPSETRRQNLARKELAWLRRGAAGPDVEAEVPHRRGQRAHRRRTRTRATGWSSQRFASQRLGKDVVDIEDVDLKRGEKVLLEHATWRIGPGDRIGIVGVNGAGKTSLLRADLGGAGSRRRARQARPDGRDAAPDPGPRRDRPRGRACCRPSSRSGA